MTYVGYKLYCNKRFIFNQTKYCSRYVLLIIWTGQILNYFILHPIYSVCKLIKIITTSHVIVVNVVFP